MSLLGTALTMFALPTLAILVLRATALQIGILTAMARLPFPILGMPVGAIVAVLAAVPTCAVLGTLRIPYSTASRSSPA